MTHIQPLHTPCKNCVFAEYENITQTGCFIGYLNRYKQMGAEILDVYDETKEFSVINNKKCIGYRENKWFAQFGLENASTQAKATKYFDNEYIRYIVVIDLKTIEPTEFKDIIFELSNTTIKPQKIVILRYLDNQKFKYSEIETVLKNSNMGCSWRIQTILDNTFPHNATMYDIIRNNKNTRFLLYIKHNINNINSIIEYTNTKVYKKLESMIACGNKDQTCIMYASAPYRLSIETEKNILDDPETYIEL